MCIVCQEQEVDATAVAEPAIDCSEKKQQQEEEHSHSQPTQRHCKHNKAVHFDLDATREYLDDNAPSSSSSSSLLQRQVRWYGKFEYNAWQAIVAKAAKHMRHEPVRPFSYTHVLEHLDYLCHHHHHHAPPLACDDLRLSPPDRQALQQLFARGAPVGLERWAVTRLETHANNRRREQLKTVQRHNENHQDDDDDATTATTTNANDTKEEEDALATACQRISRPGRLMATALAQALADSLQQER